MTMKKEKDVLSRRNFLKTGLGAAASTCAVAPKIQMPIASMRVERIMKSTFGNSDGSNTCV